MALSAQRTLALPTFAQRYGSLTIGARGAAAHEHAPRPSSMVRPMQTPALDACLPAPLRGSPVTRVAAGLSGAGVYKVGERHVLKVSPQRDGWIRRRDVLERAATAGLAPRVVHSDEARLAIVSEYVADRGFAAWLHTPASRGEAIAALGRALRRVHQLPLRGEAAQPLPLLAGLWTNELAGFPLPAAITETVVQLRAEEPPPYDGPLVLSHNDLNPSNLVFDGERLLFLDWDLAAPNDPLYDLATVAMFFRFDEATCLALLAAYRGEPVTALPPRFRYDRRLVAALSGSMFLRLARASGHLGAVDAEPPALADIYQGLRSGALDLSAGNGQFAFGLALLAAASAT